MGAGNRRVAPGEGVSLADCPARFTAWRAMDNGNLRRRWVGTLQWAMFPLSAAHHEQV